MSLPLDARVSEGMAFGRPLEPRPIRGVNGATDASTTRGAILDPPRPLLAQDAPPVPNSLPPRRTASRPASIRAPPRGRRSDWGLRPQPPEPPRVQSRQLGAAVRTQRAAPRKWSSQWGPPPLVSCRSHCRFAPCLVRRTPGSAASGVACAAPLVSFMRLLNSAATRRRRSAASAVGTSLLRSRCIFKRPRRRA